MPDIVTKAVLLAGGKGSRLHPLTLEIPKPLITIRKRPLINYNLALFARAGVREVTVIIRPDDRLDYERWAREYGQEFLDAGMSIRFVGEPEPMGTAGFFLRYLREWVGGNQVIVSNGDDIKKISLGELIAFHAAAGTAATVALVAEKERKDCGFVLVHENKIVAFLEKQPMPISNFTSSGLYLFSPSVFRAADEFIPAEKRFIMFETDLFPALAERRELGGYVSSDGTVFDCGTFERWERAIREA